MQSRKLENILIIDTETGGLDPQKEPLLEVGAILYNIPTKAILLKATGFLKAESNNAAHINNIDVEWLQKMDMEIESSFMQMIGLMVKLSDVVIAHNAKFDRGFMEAHSLIGEECKKAHWGCSAWDLRWPPMMNKKLQTIAAHYGVDYTKAHRALDDCEILLECLLKLDTFVPQLEAIFRKRRV